MVFLAVTVAIVGVLCGLTGVGGILVIPALEAFAGLSVQSSMATAMFSFVFTSIAATWLFYRGGFIDWGPTIPLSLSAGVFSYLGALTNSLVPTFWLSVGLSLVIFFCGVMIIRPAKGGRSFTFDRHAKSHVALMAGVGSAVGFLSGLTGVGGPVLSIPAMVVMGFPPLAAIASGQVLSLAVCGAGSVGYLLYGSIDFGVASWITVIQLGGLLLGIRMARTLPTHRLRSTVAVVCLLLGGFLLVRSLGDWLALP